MTVLRDWFINPDHGPIIVAQEMGFFADQGLDVEIVAPADPPKRGAAGQADLGVSYQPQLHLQVAEDPPLIRVSAAPLNCLLADGPIRTIPDLAGGKVGFSLAGVEEALLGTILKNHGLSSPMWNWSTSTGHSRLR